jgi:hypothetical protein
MDIDYLENIFNICGHNFEHLNPLWCFLLPLETFDINDLVKLFSLQYLTKFFIIKLSPLGFVMIQD